MKTVLNEEEERQEAIEEYRRKVEGPIFDRYRNDVEMYGNHLKKTICSHIAKIKQHDIPFDPLDEDDYPIARDALVLPFYIHYATGEYVEEWKDWALEEKVDACEETCLRDELVDSLIAFCTAGAAVAKDIGAERQRLLYRRALEEIEKHCVERYNYYGGGMSKKRAEMVVGWICSATNGLWAEMQIENLHEEWKKGRVTPVAQKASAKSDKPTAMPKTKGIEFTVTLGAWTERFATFDAATRTLTLQVRKNAKKTFIVPQDYKNAWMILKWLLESPNPEGWHTIDEEHSDLRKSWRQQFIHSSKRNPDMVELARHIHSIKKSGNRGATTLRLEQTPQKSNKGRPGMKR